MVFNLCVRILDKKPEENLIRRVWEGWYDQYLQVLDYHCFDTWCPRLIHFRVYAILLPCWSSLFEQIYMSKKSWGFLRWNVWLASCPWGPVSANGVNLLTEIYVIYMETHTSHCAMAQCFHAKNHVCRSNGCGRRGCYGRNDGRTEGWLLMEGCAWTAYVLSSVGPLLRHNAHILMARVRGFGLGCTRHEDLHGPPVVALNLDLPTADE